MKYVEVLPLVGTGSKDQSFTYQTEEDINIGSLVLVPLRNRVVKGFIVRFVKKPDFETRDINKILSLEPVLTETQLALAQKIAGYYFCPISDVISTILPFEFGKKRRPISQPEPGTRNLEPSYKLTVDQQKIFNSIVQGTTSNRFLLFGVTGSGKTEIYLQLVAEALKRGRTSIILVPEISLTPQAMDRFTKRLGNTVAIWHSGIRETEKYDTWQKIKSGQKKVILGARSAIFTPVSNLAYIIIDEEHETSYKQDQNPRYETVRVAEWLSESADAKLILGSATPKVETYEKAIIGEYKLCTLNKRIVQDSMPPVKIVDMRDEFKKGNKSIFSENLADAIRETLKNHKQTLLFLNRRGAATYITCRDCGYVVECPNCEIPLTYHPFPSNLRSDLKPACRLVRDAPRSDLGLSLLCHHCDYKAQIPTICPNCKSYAIKYFGLGTQKVEIEARKLFPKAKIARMDRDTTKKRGAHDEIYSGFLNKDYDILIGTQIIAKGWDMPNVSLVGVISADTMLHLPDFRSSERTFDLLTQVSGRTGRGYHPGKVIIQTYNPDNYAIKAAAKHDFLGFYTKEIAERKKYSYPPFSTLIKLAYSSKSAEKAQEEAEQMAKVLSSELATKDGPLSAKRSVLFQKIQLLGPSPAFLPKLSGKYRYQIVIKAGSRFPARTYRSGTGRQGPGSSKRTKTSVSIVDEKFKLEPGSWNLEPILKIIKEHYKPGWTVDVNPESLL